MKKFVLAALLALPLIGLAQQKASAWGGGCFTIGMDVTFKWDFKRWCNDSCPGDGGAPLTSYDNHPAFYTGHNGSAVYNPAAPAAVPSFPPAPKPADIPPVTKTGLAPSNPSTNGYQPVGYYFYPTNGYGSYQVPSYWYGR